MIFCKKCHGQKKGVIGSKSFTIKREALLGSKSDTIKGNAVIGNNVSRLNRRVYGTNTPP